jgi:2-hydroxychromene-2-carboxylate isomerase
MLERAMNLIRCDLVRLRQELKMYKTSAELKHTRDAITNYTKLLLQANRDVRDEERLAMIKAAGLTDAQLRKLAKEAGITDQAIAEMGIAQ